MRLLANTLLMTASLSLAFTWIVAPMVCFFWLLFTWAWSPIFFILLSAISVALLSFAMLIPAGLLGPISIIGLPIFSAAYVQFSFLVETRDRFEDSYPWQFLLASVTISAIPTHFLGKGYDNQPSIIIARGAMGLASCVAAWAFSTGTLAGYWHFFGIHASGFILGGFLALFVMKVMDAAI